MVKVVLDTNVWISALNFGGNPAKILKLAVQKQIRLYSSQTLFAELLGVLRKKFGYSEERIEEVKALFKRRVKFREPQTTLNVIKTDLADNRVLECGLEARADFIVSGDKDILSLGNFKGIKIVNPAAFLKIYEKT